MPPIEFVRRDRGWLHLPTGRTLTLIAGAEEPTEDETKAAADKAAADAEAAKKQADEAEAKRKADEQKLGDAGKAALDAERKAKRDAEKRAKDAEEKLKSYEDANASELEKAQKRAEEAEGKVTAATEKLRQANLLTALGAAGLTGAKAKAAARLLDSVEYGDDDEPTNLSDAITAAKAEYGDEQFKGAKPAAPAVDGGEGNEDRDGPALTADELAAAKASGMTPEEYAAYKSPQPKLPAESK